MRRMKFKDHVMVQATEQIAVPVYYTVQLDTEHNGKLGHITEIIVRIGRWRGDIIAEFKNDNTTIFNPAYEVARKAMIIISDLYKEV